MSEGKEEIDRVLKAWGGADDLGGVGVLVSVYERQVASKTVAAR
jgi:hypothetical protein